ncbi:prepilin-type N-terminal cleavage/methylation domain-containing protein [Thiomicrospira pelophila]|uniref:prepilin-type N-terminal cleavage/methylation domain-containing protein n=1 Tax=Thiomicrospira pelophila TaxID=934 RepID=UPI0004A751B2|nr:prepilin-type N-terminal cleavage/methylation domain-containing protein [Thiomicrospira pelophila]
MQHQNKQKGFTLIEIAIVLVIIGLLLGGVLKGQELIKSAKTKAAASDVNAYSVALVSYQDRFGDLFNKANYTVPVTDGTEPDSNDMLKELADRGLISQKNQHALGGAVELAKNGDTTGTVIGLATAANTTVAPQSFSWAVCYRDITTEDNVQALIRAIDGAGSDFITTPTAYQTGRARLVIDDLTSAPNEYAPANTTVCFEI